MSSDPRQWAPRHVGPNRVPSWIAKARPDAPRQVTTLRPPRPLTGIEGPGAYGFPITLGEPVISRIPSAPPPGPSIRPSSIQGLLDRSVEVERMRDDLVLAIEQFSTARRELFERSEAQLVALALACARRLAGHQLEIDPSAVQYMIQEGLETLSATDHFEIRLGRRFESVAADVTAILHGRGLHCEVICDDRLSPDAVSIQSELGSVDESLEARFAVLVRDLCKKVGK